MAEATVYYRKDKGRSVELGKERVPNVTTPEAAAEKFQKRFPGRRIIQIEITYPPAKEGAE